MEMAALIHDEQNAQNAIKLLEASDIAAIKIDANLSHGGMLRGINNGYQIMVSSKDLNRAQELLVSSLPSLNSTSSEISTASFIQNKGKWLACLSGIFVLFLILCVISFH